MGVARLTPMVFSPRPCILLAIHDIFGWKSEPSLGIGNLWPFSRGGLVMGRRSGKRLVVSGLVAYGPRVEGVDVCQRRKALLDLG